MAHVTEVQLSSRTFVNIKDGIAFTRRLPIPWNSRTLEAWGRSLLIRCLRTKKHVAKTADIASNEMKEMAIMDHAEFSALGYNQIATFVSPAYFANVSPDVLATNTDIIFIPAAFPAIATNSLYSLS